MIAALTFLISLVSNAQASVSVDISVQVPVVVDVQVTCSPSGSCVLHEYSNNPGGYRLSLCSSDIPYVVYEGRRVEVGDGCAELANRFSQTNVVAVETRLEVPSSGSFSLRVEPN